MIDINKKCVLIVVFIMCLINIYLTVDAKDDNADYERIGLVKSEFSVDILDDSLTSENNVSIVACDINGVYVYVVDRNSGNVKYLFVDYSGNVFENNNGFPAVFNDGIAVTNTDGVVHSRDNNEKYGYIDENYNWLRNPYNHIVSNVSEGYSLVCGEGKEFLINKKGTPCFMANRFYYNSPIILSEIGKLFSDNKTICEKNGKLYFVDKDLNCIEFAEKNDVCDYSGGTAVISKIDMSDEEYIKITSEMFNDNGNCIYKHEQKLESDEYDSSMNFPRVLSNGNVIFTERYHNEPKNQLYDFPQYYFKMVSSDGKEIATTDESFRLNNLQSLGDDILFDELSGYCYNMKFERLLEPKSRNKYCCDVNGNVAVTVEKDKTNEKMLSLKFTVIHPKDVELNKAVKVVELDKIKPLTNKNEVLTNCICIDNDGVSFNLPPIEENDRILVPMRRIFEELGADVSWDNETNTAIAKKGDVEIKLCIDSDVMIKNGEQIKLDTPARLIDDAYTFVPLRAVSEAFGCRVEWTEELKRVDILTAK